MSPHESVSDWIAGLKGGDSHCVKRLYDRYWQRLVTLCEHRLRTSRKRLEDEEGIAARVFESICLGAQAGRFDDINNRDNLWWTMMRLTKSKVVDHIRREEAKKRQQERNESDLRRNDSFTEQFRLEGRGSEELSPDRIVEDDEHLEHLFSLLRDDQLRTIALLRIEGYTVDEIASKVKISPRSVERKLALIRATWAATLDERA
jgi:RNA polymerase sigma factor (sigma-70 family)